VHSSRELRSSAFSVLVDGVDATLAGVFPDFVAADRVGIVMRRPCAAVGASALLLCAVTAFYDVQRARDEDFFVYPDYFVFHVGRKLGAFNRSTSGRRTRRSSSPTTPRSCCRRSTTAG